MRQQGDLTDAHLVQFKAVLDTAREFLRDGEQLIQEPIDAEGLDRYARESRRKNAQFVFDVFTVLVHLGFRAPWGARVTLEGTTLTRDDVDSRSLAKCDATWILTRCRERVERAKIRMAEDQQRRQALKEKRQRAFEDLGFQIPQSFRSEIKVEFGTAVDGVPRYNVVITKRDLTAEQITQTVTTLGLTLQSQAQYSAELDRAMRERAERDLAWAAAQERQRQEAEVDHERRLEESRARGSEV